MNWSPANFTEACTGNQPSALALLAFITHYLGNSYDTLLTNENQQGESSDTTEYDFIVVGAGRAGCIVANRLSEITDWKNSRKNRIRQSHVDSLVPVYIDAWKELGLNETDYNNGDLQEVSRVQFTSFHGTRMSSNGASIKPIRGQRSNLFSKTKDHVTKILIDEKTKRARGVEYEVFVDGMTVSKQAFATKEIIVSAGVVDSTKLLMLSGIGPAKDLEDLNIKVIKDLPVGHNLHDHILLPIFQFDSIDNRSFTSYETQQNDLVYWLSTHEGPWSQTGNPAMVASYQSSYEKEPNNADIQYYMRGLTKGSCISTFFSGSYYDDDISIQALLLARRSRGQLKLNRTDPVRGQPDIRMNMLTDAEDAKVY